MIEDAQLLRRYLEDRSEEAFTELVRRHVNLVYFAALRRVGGDRHLADDVTQGVFADLARKAPSLKDRTVLAGWLYTSTRFAAAQAVRTEQRRRTHEQEAQAMHELHSTPEPGWDQVRPIIDEAMDKLNEREREAILLRFFENLSLAEVGAKFSLSPDAARMRIDRALDKLRGLLAKRRVGSTSAALAAIFASQSGLAAPSGLVAKIVAGVFSQAGTVTAVTLGLWKILTAVVIAALGTALIVHEAGVRREKAETVPAALAGYENDSSSIEVAGSKNVEAKAVVPPLASTPTLSPASGGDFGRLSEMQKKILKKLWEHEKAFPDHPPLRWGFKLAPGVPNFPAFIAAVDLLQSDHLVGIGPKKGIVCLTDKGDAFCKDHDREIDAYMPRP